MGTFQRTEQHSALLGLECIPTIMELLDLLAVPNTVPNNALVEVFGMDPIPFSGEHIAYLRDTSAGEALSKFFTGKVTS